MTCSRQVCARRGSRQGIPCRNRCYCEDRSAGVVPRTAPSCSHPATAICAALQRSGDAGARKTCGPRLGGLIFHKLTFDNGSLQELRPGKNRDHKFPDCRVRSRFSAHISFQEALLLIRRIRSEFATHSVSTAHRPPRIQILTGLMLLYAVLTRLAAVEMFVRSTTHQKVGSGEARRRQARLEEVAMNEMLNMPLTGAPSDA